jgi:hypothetical protein
VKPTFFFSGEILHIFYLKKNLSTSLPQIRAIILSKSLPSNVPLEKKKRLPFLSTTNMVVGLYNARGPQDSTFQKRHTKSCHCANTSVFMFARFCKTKL